MRNIPLANPDKVSIRPYLKGDLVKACVCLTQGMHPPVRESFIWGPFCHYRSEQADTDRQAIECHMNSFWNRQRIETLCLLNSPSEMRPKLFVQTPYSIWTSMKARFNIKK